MGGGGVSVVSHGCLHLLVDEDWTRQLGLVDVSLQQFLPELVERVLVISLFNLDRYDLDSDLRLVSDDGLVLVALDADHGPDDFDGSALFNILVNHI